MTSCGAQRWKQELTDKGAVWMRRSMVCVLSLWEPLHRQTQGQKFVLLACIHSARLYNVMAICQSWKYACSAIPRDLY